MGALSADVLKATADKLIAAHQQASRTNDWLFFVDRLYAADCVYTCEYAGVMNVTANGIDEIKATHYGRDMRVGWEGWSFPYEGVARRGSAGHTRKLRAGSRGLGYGRCAAV